MATNSNRNLTILLLLAVVKFLLPFVLSDHSFELHRDEYLYFEQGNHIGFGYLENPPVIGWLASLSSMAGGSFFWIKFWPSLFGAINLLITAAIAREFGGGLFAQVVAALGIIFSAYLRVHFLFQPNFLDIFFWSLSVYYLVRYINTQEQRYLFYLAIALAFGFMSKYSALFFILSLLISILFSRYRSIYVKKAFWRAFALGILVVLPNLFWQYMHHWPLVHHMNELRETQLRYLNKTDFIKEQVLMLFPVLFVWTGGLVWLLRNTRYRIIGLVYIFVMILLMMGSGKGYYALGAYPMLLAAGGTCFEHITKRLQWTRYALITIILLLFLPSIPLLLPLQPPPQMAAFNRKYELEKIGLLKWEDQENHLLQQDFADMLGWKELTQKTESFFQKLPVQEQAQTIVYCRNYGLAGSMVYYAKKPEFSRWVISDNGSFLLWIPNRLWFRNLVFVGREMPGKDDVVFQHFERVTLIDSCTNIYSRQYGIKIIYFENASDSAVQLAHNGLRKMKAQFGE